MKKEQLTLDLGLLIKDDVEDVDFRTSLSRDLESQGYRSKDAQEMADVIATRCEQLLEERSIDELVEILLMLN